MKIRVSLSVVNFKERAMRIWKLEEWQGIDDTDQDVLFFGLYTLHDFDAFWYHEGKKTVFWCGSDILNVMNSVEFRRRLKVFPKTEHYCETREEYDNLKQMGIETKIVPSFLEDINDFPISYVHSDKPHIWMCAHPRREEEYGVDQFLKMAKLLPDYTFHIYGIYDWMGEEKTDNIIYHGQVSNDVLNKEIRAYQCGFRGNKHEGFSEVLAKALFLGQYPVSFMPFEKIWNWKTDEQLYNQLKRLKEMKDWNHEGYNYWKNNINKFPWMK